ncbi:MAG: TonB-dependent receptor, partial [Parvularculaceae bacterium]
MALMLTATFVALEAATTGSLAQPAEDGGRARTAAASDEVIVTARRREESLQDVPVSVSAFTNEGLENRGISNLQGINNFTPNLELTNGRPDGGGSAAQIYIRGVGQSDFLFPNDPGVGLYVDDIYLARTVGGMLGLVDVERVEVLRGPQGTLYGKNTIGGAVKIVTVKPQLDEWSGRIRATYGSFDRMDFSGAVNIPLGDVLAARLEAAKFERDGYVTRLFDGIDLGNEDKEVLRGDLLFQPSEDFSFRLTGDIQSQRQNGAPGNLLLVVPSTAAAVPIPGAIDPVTNQQDFVDGTGLVEALYNPVVVPVIAPGLGLPATTAFDSRWVTGDPHLSNGTAPVRDDNDIWGVSAVADWALNDDLAVKSMTSYRQLQATFGRDGDHSPLPIVSTFNRFEQNQFSQELQLSGSSFGDRLKWLAGGYYFHEEGDDRNNVQLLSGTFDVVGFELDLIPINSIESNSYAGFLHGDFEVTDRIALTAGIRYTYEEKTLERDHRLTKSGVIITRREKGLPDLGDFSPIGPPLEENWDALSPKAGISYKANDDTLLYFSFSQGFKSGGWSPRPQTGTENVPIDQETLYSNEV